MRVLNGTLKLTQKENIVTRRSYYEDATAFTKHLSVSGTYFSYSSPD